MGIGKSQALLELFFRKYQEPNTRVIYFPDASDLLSAVKVFQVLDIAFKEDLEQMFRNKQICRVIVNAAEAAENKDALHVCGALQILASFVSSKGRTLYFICDQINHIEPKSGEEMVAAALRDEPNVVNLYAASAMNWINIAKPLDVHYINIPPSGFQFTDDEFGYLHHCLKKVTGSDINKDAWETLKNALKLGGEEVMRLTDLVPLQVAHLFGIVIMHDVEQETTSYAMNPDNYLKLARNWAKKIHQDYRNGIALEPANSKIMLEGLTKTVAHMVARLPCKHPEVDLHTMRIERVDDSTEAPYRVIPLYPAAMDGVARCYTIMDLFLHKETVDPAWLQSFDAPGERGLFLERIIIHSLATLESDAIVECLDLNASSEPVTFCDTQEFGLDQV